MRGKLADVGELQAYKQAAQLDIWQQYQHNQQQFVRPAPAHVAKMYRWLESGDAILVAEAEAFFSLRPGEER